jgi:hypothetical protein
MVTPVAKLPRALRSSRLLNEGEALFLKLDINMLLSVEI